MVSASNQVKTTIRGGTENSTPLFASFPEASAAFLESVVSEPHAREWIAEVLGTVTSKRTALARAIWESLLWMASTVAAGAVVGGLVNKERFGMVALVALAAWLTACGALYFRKEGLLRTQLSVAFFAHAFLDHMRPLDSEMAALATNARRQRFKTARYKDAFDHADKALKSYVQLTGEKKNYRIRTLTRESLLSILRFFSTLARKNEELPRCGLLVRHPEDPTTIVPLVVYHPTSDKYVSTRVFSTSDFSGKLLAGFALRPAGAAIENYLRSYIKDTTREREQEDPRFVVHPDQDEPIGAIFGNIVYVRDSRGVAIAQGALNIDCKDAEGLDDEFLRETALLQKPMFRVLNAILERLARDPKLFESVYHPDGNGG